MARLLKNYLYLKQQSLRKEPFVKMPIISINQFRIEENLSVKLFKHRKMLNQNDKCHMKDITTNSFDYFRVWNNYVKR